MFCGTSWVRRIGDVDDAEPAHLLASDGGDRVCGLHVGALDAGARDLYLIEFRIRVVLRCLGTERLKREPGQYEGPGNGSHRRADKPRKSSVFGHDNSPRKHDLSRQRGGLCSMSAKQATR